MEYAIARIIEGMDMPSLKARTVEALKTEGFGVITEIDLQATLQAKLGKEHLPHLILGACSPAFAHEAVTLEPRISTLLPCNVTLRQLPGGAHEVAVIDPVVAMGMVNEAAVAPLAAAVRDALQRALRNIGP
jgi:uncharacterized protein (DUF302 family)